jgi:hypothetical protein
MKLAGKDAMCADWRVILESNISRQNIKRRLHMVKLRKLNNAGYSTLSCGSLNIEDCLRPERRLQEPPKDASRDEGTLGENARNRAVKIRRYVPYQRKNQLKL